jgi:hypothetical protein
MTFPNLQQTLVTFKMTRMLDAKEATIFVDKAAAAHDNVTPLLRRYFFRNTMECAWQQGII